MYGLQILYSLIYRCQSAQQMILCGDSQGTLRFIRLHHGGDVDVMKWARKFELAICDPGWRGNVEKLMEMEMRNETIPEEYLVKSNWQREFSKDWKFPLEVRMSVVAVAVAA